jgi:chitinase
MNRSALVLTAAIAAACSSGSTGAQGDSSAFAGYWSGTFLAAGSGIASSSSNGSLVLFAIDSKTVEAAGFCSDGSGPRGTVTSDTQLALGGVTCPTFSESTCASVALTVNGGSATRTGDSILISMDAAEKGCGQTVPFTLTFTGKRGSATDPTASISVAPGSNVTAGTSVTLDGSASADPQGAALTYQWTLQRPPGSIAQLTSTSGSGVSFTADVPGTFVAGLTVTAGTRTSSPAQATIVASPSIVVGTNAPVAAISAPQAGTPGIALSFDASGSRSNNGGALIYSWVLTSSPSGSTAQFGNPTASIVSLMPDLIGSYTAQVTVRDGTLTATASATVRVTAAVTSTLSFRPIDAQYSRTLDKLIMTSDQPARLHVYEPVAGADVAIALPLTPTCLALSSDGKFAVVGHDAWVTYVDLAAGAVIQTWPIDATAGQVVLGDAVSVSGRATRFAYVFPLRDQWVSIHNVDLGTGAEQLSELVYAGMYAVLEPGTNHIFGVTTNLSPTQIYRFDLDGTTGVAGGNAQSPYWGDHPMGSILWMSTDGTQLLTGAGTRFRTTDLTYAGTASDVGSNGSNFVGLLWADYSPDGSHWLVQPGTVNFGGQSTNDSGFELIDSQFLANPSVVSYPVFQRAGSVYPLHGRRVFYDSTGTHTVALAQIDSSAAALLDYTVLRF